MKRRDMAQVQRDTAHAWGAVFATGLAAWRWEAALAWVVLSLTYAAVGMARVRW
jgi:hypothetical protein